MEGKRFCSIRETSRRFGISESILRQLVAQKKLPHIMTGVKCLLDTETIESSLAKIAEESCRK